LLLEKLTDSVSRHRATLETKLNEIAENLTSKLTSMQALLEKYKKNPFKDSGLLTEIRSVKKSLKNDWKEWREVVKAVSREHPGLHLS
jgi:rubrerythrin